MPQPQPVTIKEIADFKEFHIQFFRTKVYKRSYGEDDETLIDEYTYHTNDEFPSEIIWMPSVGRGLVTWFNFNKVERLDENGIIDYHKNILIQWKYSKRNEHYELVEGVIPRSSVKISIVRHQDQYYAFFLIPYENHYFRIEFSDPLEDCFKEVE